MANVLDPRLKLKYVKFCFCDLYDYDKAQLLTNKVKDTLMSLYEFYLKIDEVVDNNRQKQDVNAIDDVEVDVNTLDRFKRHLLEVDNVENKNEVERYLIEACEDPNNDKLDILGWWKSNALKYKTLLKVAQHVLAIPISTVASESAFSTGSRVLDHFQSSLSPATVQALICC
ncbi:zinc finger BED domain-containing protein DAYSLEEPER-like [Populus alba]|uniref:zinc finger BED domain-containing protein DAYSLEEPER-like n=1 Tax=Populus alba TaxID=43335 RepID=UPI003CC7377A